MSSSTEIRKPIRLAIIQMSRLGDSIQSLMALRAAKQLYPELDVTFITHEGFAVAAENTSWITEVIPFPTARLLSPLLNGRRSLTDSLPDLAEWLEPLVEQPFDLAVNWTFSDATSFLLGLLPARVKLGYSRRKTGEMRNADGWSHYIQAAVQSDVGQGIHITDILTTQLLTALQVHFGEPVDPGSAAVTSKTFFSHRLDQVVCEQWNTLGRRWISVQLGASPQSTPWAPARWAELVGRILRRHDEVNIILLGTANERSLAEEFQTALAKELGDTSRFKGRVVSKVGSTPFELWAKIVADSQWLFSADTAAIHLASVLGTRVFNVNTGDERFRETGPYGNAHYVVKNVSPLVAYGVWSYANTEWQHRRQHTVSEHLNRLEIGESLDSGQVYRSRIRPTDEGGGVHFESLKAQPLSLENWLCQAISYQARSWYCGWVPPITQELSKKDISPDLIQIMRQVQEGTQVLDQILSEGIRSAEELQRFCSKLKSEKLMRSEDRERLQELSSKLLEIEQLIHRLTVSQPSLQFFSRLTRVLMHNLEGAKVAELSADTAEAYRFIRGGVNGIQAWTQETIRLAKPAAITSPTKVISLHARHPSS